MQGCGGAPQVWRLPNIQAAGAHCWTLLLWVKNVSLLSPHPPLTPCSTLLTPTRWRVEEVGVEVGAHSLRTRDHGQVLHHPNL